jgi:hypothetical protein
VITYQPYNIIMHGNPRYRRGSFPFQDDDGPGAKGYEERIRVTLNAIGRTGIGRALFRSLNPHVPVYILPYTGDACNAVTGQLSSDWKKGIRIQYSPETWAYDKCGRFPGYRPVESLFHEMVHASRFTNYHFAGLNQKPLEKMQDHEEFLAVMMTNVFRSEQGAKKFNRDYTTGELVSQSDLEAFLSSRMEYINAFACFLSDSMVKLTVPLTAPFNPFRDFKRLQADSLARITKAFIPQLLRR